MQRVIRRAQPRGKGYGDGKWAPGRGEMGMEMGIGSRDGDEDRHLISVAVWCRREWVGWPRSQIDRYIKDWVSCANVCSM